MMLSESQIKDSLSNINNAAGTRDTDSGSFRTQPIGSLDVPNAFISHGDDGRENQIQSVVISQYEINKHVVIKSKIADTESETSQSSDQSNQSRVTFKNRNSNSSSSSNVAGTESINSNDSIHSSPSSFKFIKMKQHDNNDLQDQYNLKPIEACENQCDTKTYNSDDSLVGIHVHSCDPLRMNLMIRHPSVLVHVVDLDKKEYLIKSEKSKNVTYNQEHSNHILPNMTRPFDFKERRSLIPQWEEMLIFNEPLSRMVKSSVIFLFELVDFLELNNGTVDYSLLNSNLGWHRIAWAFLKPVGANNINNVEKKLRLQLYKPYLKSSSKKTNNVPDVFHWYCHKPWTIYPSTLYVTVQNIFASNVDAKPRQRSCTPLQPEVGSVASIHTVSTHEFSLDDDADVCINTLTNMREFANVEWSRLPGQSCQMPNSKISTFYPDTRGCLSLKFSNSGFFLACGTSTDIFIYSAISGSLFFNFSGHHGLIYSLHWSLDDTLILTSSADCTTCIWDFNHRKPIPLQILPHPSYVYCSEFMIGYTVVVTGCFDGVVRIWTKHNTTTWQLTQELTTHNGYVNAICALSRTEFCTGDSEGVIISWIYVDNKWKQLKIIKLCEIQGVVINNLIRHPGGKRLLIHTRDSLLRIMDLHTCAVIQWFQGGINDMLQCTSVLTPCGSLLFASSEDGTVNVWDANTGAHVAFYSGSLVAGCGVVDYHPYDHIASFSAYSTTRHSSTFLIKYIRNARNDAGLRIMFDSAATHEYKSHFNKHNINNCVGNNSKLAVKNLSKKSKNQINKNLNMADTNVCNDASHSVISSPYSVMPGDYPLSTKKAANGIKYLPCTHDEDTTDPIEHIIRHMDRVLASYDTND